MRAKKWVRIVPLATLVILMGCATGKPLMDTNPYTPQSFDISKYEAKVRNFQVIMDASSSMSQKYNEERKFWHEKRFLSAFGKSVPSFDLTGSLRSFGHCRNISLSQTELQYGPAKYRSADFQDALDRVSRPGGTSDLAAALDASGTDLEDAQGPIALIVASDGKSNLGDPVEAAAALKDKFGDRLCIYTVLVGYDEAGESLLQEIADVGACGGMVHADKLTVDAAMADFVETIFLAKAGDSDGDGVPDSRDKCPGTPSGAEVDSMGCALDSDGDGVPDYADKCPGTPSGAEVDSMGCALDSDGDGVADYADKCPGTPEGIKVDAMGCAVDSDGDGVVDSADKCPGTPEGTKVDGSGCPVRKDVDSDGDGVFDSRDSCPGTPAGVKTDARGCWVLEGVFFDTNKATLQPRSRAVLDDLAAVLRKNPDLDLRIEGHTDSVGSHAYNMKLSEERARSVMGYLIGAGVSADRLSYAGYGPDRPAATNETAEGRSMNRRVELAPVQ